MEAALLGFAALFALGFAGLPIAFAMMLVGFGGFVILVGWTPALSMLAQTVFGTVLNYGLSVVPLFVLMGNFVNHSGLSHELYRASYTFLGHRRGGLAMATIVACSGFSAVCGSSVATAATMSRVALPPMRRFGYADSLAVGSIAAGGTLGILIPPSVILILYGIMTQTDIGALFIAGIVPGLLGVAGYVAAIGLACRLNPELGPRGERSTARERLAAVSKVWGIAVLFLAVIGGIYFGVFTPTEAAGVGAFGAFLFALLRRTMAPRDFGRVLTDAAETTAMIFVILIGAVVFSNFINITQLPQSLEGWIDGLGLPPIAVIVAILAIYIVLGCVLETLSMLLLTLPIFFPMVDALGFDPVWFGILVVVVIEIGLITPPIGLNVYVLNAALPDVPLGRIFRGVGPFVAADVVRLALLVAVPSLVLFLPSMMG